MADTTPTLPTSQWQGQPVRLLTGMSHYGPLAEFAPPVDQLARSVAFIRRADGTGGSGFLVAPDLLLTNNHVLPTPELAATAEVWFNYALDGAGTLLAVDKYGCDPQDFFYTSPFSHAAVTPGALDFTLVRVNRQLGNGAAAATPGATWGHLPILGYGVFVSADGQLTIIQHPKQQPTVVGQGTKQVQFQDDLKLQYVTDTEPGSSGSPVFNQFWHVVALHHAGVALPPGFGTGFGNEGISITAIRAELASRFPALALPDH